MRVVVGRIARAHGIRGELAVEVRTDEPERRFAVGSVLLTERGPLTVESTRRHQGRVLVRFDEVPDRTAAEALHGLLLEVELDTEDGTDDGSGEDGYWDHQLVGLRVRTDGGRDVGTVTSVLHLPHQDLLDLEVEGRAVQVPFVEALVPEVDLASGHLVVVDVPGLLDPSAAQE